MKIVLLGSNSRPRKERFFAMVEIALISRPLPLARDLNFMYTAMSSANCEMQTLLGTLSVIEDTYRM